MGLTRSCREPWMENEPAVDNPFLAPARLTEEVARAAETCPACRDIRRRSQVPGAVCYTHFLEGTRQRPPEAGHC